MLKIKMKNILANEILEYLKHINDRIILIILVIKYVLAV